jgi:hypothetical protein
MKAPIEKIERLVQQTALEIARNGESKLLTRVIEGYYNRIPEQEKKICSLEEFNKRIQDKLSKLKYVVKA